MGKRSVDDFELQTSSNDRRLALLVAAHSEIESSDIAAEFLAVILAGSYLRACRPIDESCTQVSNCKVLLSQRLDLHRELLHAYRTGKAGLISFMDHAFLPPFLPSPGHAYVNELRSRMQALAKTGTIFEPWSGRHVYDDAEINQFIESLRIPNPYNDPSKACIILHDLGELAHHSRVTKIFAGKNTFLVNGSGTGKTRLCYEGLCAKWGLYFTFHVDSGGLGSRDIELLVRDFQSNHHENPTSPENIPKMAHLLGSILLARLSVLLLFLESVNDSNSDLREEHKKWWLLVQLSPHSLTRDTIWDPFEMLASLINTEQDTYLAENIRDALRKIRKITGNEKLVIAIDEAQMGLELLTHAFRGKKKLLHILIEAFRELTGDQCTLVCAGIDLPQSEFVDTDGSDFVWTSDTGAFDDPNEQEKYVIKFLPPSLRDSPTGQFLVARIWRWLRGRHRFTAAFIGVLLTEGLKHPHTRLDDMLHSLLSIQPVDAVKYSCEEGTHRLWEQRLAGFNVLTILPKQHDLFLDILLRYLVTRDGAHTFRSDQTQFVYDGWARFVDGNLGQIVLDEPLALLKIARHLFPFPEATGFRLHHPATLIRSLRTNVPQTTEGLVHCIVLYLAEVFKPHRPLNKIFAFPSEPPPWADQSASLVRFHRLDTNEITHSTTAPYDFESFRPLAARTTSLDQTLLWMEHAGQEEPPFCLPIHSPNVDLFCALKLADGSLVWVALKAFATAESIDSDQLAMAFANLERNHISGDVDETTRSRIDLAVDSLPKFSSERFLRVVSSFPFEIEDLEEFLPEDTFDAATLSFAALETKKDQVLQTELFDAMIAGVLAGHTGKSRWESDDGALHTATHRIRHLVPEEAAIHQAVPTATWDGRMSSEEPLVVKPKRARNKRPTASRSAAKPRTTRKTMRRAKKLDDDDDDDGPVAESSKGKRKSTVVKKVTSSRPQSALPAAQKNKGKAVVRSDSPGDEPDGSRSLALKKRKRQSDIDMTEAAQPAESDKPPAGNTRSKTRAEAKRTRKG